VPKRQLCAALMSVLLGSVWAYAETSNTSTLSGTTSSSASTPRDTTTTASQGKEAEPDKGLYVPEIWRLPPIGDASLFAQPPAEIIPTPPVLAIPPADMITMPEIELRPPISNAPASLSGILPDGLRIETKPDPNKLWNGSFNLGLDGSEGNTEAFHFRFALDATRKTEFSVITANLDYKKETAFTQTTADRLYFDGRCERLIAPTRWSVFFHETIEYDRSQPFNVRDTSDAGVGYRLVKTDLTTLIGRIGGGFSHEYGGPENGEYTPEAVFGVQLECRINKRQKLMGIVEYAPDVADFLRYRIRTQAALEMLLNQQENLGLRMGVLERYNSVPNGARPNDLDYALMLMWKF
jgi:putative salt-induced outer membrane protein YdiY